MSKWENNPDDDPVPLAKKIKLPNRPVYTQKRAMEYYIMALQINIYFLAQQLGRVIWNCISLRRSSFGFFTRPLEVCKSRGLKFAVRLYLESMQRRKMYATQYDLRANYQLVIWIDLKRAHMIRELLYDDLHLSISWMIDRTWHRSEDTKKREIIGTINFFWH